MRNPYALLYAVTIGLVLLTSCSKDKDEAPASSGSGGTNTQVQPPTANGYLTASRVTSSGGTISNGGGYFKNTSSMPVYVGTVTLNTLQLDTSYSMYHISGNSSSLDLSSGNVLWSVAGGNGYAAFTQTVDDIEFPFVYPITSADTLHKSAGFTLSCDSVSGADQVEFAVNFLTMKTLAGNVHSCAFSASELSSLSLGYHVVTITARKYSVRTINGKTIAFSKEQTLFGDIQVVD